MKITKLLKTPNVYWLILFTTLAFQASAQTSAERVNKALKSLDSITADFKQTVISDEQKVVQQSMGTVAIQRPRKFSWIYKDPYEQQIVADGKELWVYDVDLEQVTVKPMSSSLASAPIMVLMDNQDVATEFIVNDIGQRKYLFWIELEPKNKDTEYNRVYLGLENEQIKAMELRDNFGQSTRIVFENMRRDVIHDPDTFKFVPPKGVDVFGTGG